MVISLGVYLIQAGIPVLAAFVIAKLAAGRANKGGKKFLTVFLLCAVLEFGGLDVPSITKPLW